MDEQARVTLRHEERAVDRVHRELDRRERWGRLEPLDHWGLMLAAALVVLAAGLYGVIVILIAAGSVALYRTSV
jgi:hypothetical protein